MSISSKISEIKQRIDIVCQKNNINTDDIEIVAASKYATVGEVKEVYRAKISSFGENRVQELVKKQEALADTRINWHFIGHLQTNKVNKVVGNVKLIQSVDSLRLAEEINKRAKNISISQNILMQTNISEEMSKTGFKPAESLQNALEIDKLNNINLVGLMTIAPFTEDAKLLRKHFEESKKMFDLIKRETGQKFNKLSMGMSNDFEIAIEYGANIVRLGSIIFN